jgi:hypothetical protein
MNAFVRSFRTFDKIRGGAFLEASGAGSREIIGQRILDFSEKRTFLSVRGGRNQFVLELGHSEIEDEAKGVIRGVKVGVHLRHMHVDDSAAGFEFDNDSAVDDQIQAVLSNLYGRVPDPDQLFAFDLETVRF